MTSRQYSKHSLNVFMCGTTRSSSQWPSSVPGNSHTLKLRSERGKRLQKPLYLFFVEGTSHFELTGAGTGAVGEGMYSVVNILVVSAGVAVMQAQVEFGSRECPPFKTLTSRQLVLAHIHYRAYGAPLERRGGHSS
jgi:hypothetical protein